MSLFDTFPTHTQRVAACCVCCHVSVLWISVVFFWNTKGTDEDFRFFVLKLNKLFTAGLPDILKSIGASTCVSWSWSSNYHTYKFSFSFLACTHNPLPVYHWTVQRTSKQVLELEQSISDYEKLQSHPHQICLGSLLFSFETSLAPQSILMLPEHVGIIFSKKPPLGADKGPR